MQASDIPAKMTVPFGNAAVAPYIRPIPATTVDPAAASYALGFPPATGTPVFAGGVPPNMADENGILNAATAWLRWVQAGGVPVAYDPAFQSAVGGYPRGAIVRSAVSIAVEFLSTAENNITDPDALGAGWINLSAVGGALAGNLPNPTIAANVALPGNPTTSTQPVGNSSSRIATTEFANPGFLLGSTGYQIMPSGAIVQWGSANTITGIGDPVGFPVPFPNAFASVTAVEGNAAGVGWNNNQSSIFGTAPGTPDPKAGFRVWCNVLFVNPSNHIPTFGPAGGFTFNWIAFGY